MATRATEPRSVGDAVKEVAERTSSIARLELELAQLELKRKAKPLGMGIGSAIAAAVFALFMIGFLYATIAAAIALALPTWAALLIVTGVLLLQVVVLGLFAKNRFEKGSPPVPEQAIREAKLTTEALKSDGS
jgi:Flp pilus assembly protein TadB